MIIMDDEGYSSLLLMSFLFPQWMPVGNIIGIDSVSCLTSNGQHNMAKNIFDCAKLSAEFFLNCVLQ